MRNRIPIAMLLSVGAAINPRTPATRRHTNLPTDSGARALTVLLMDEQPLFRLGVRAALQTAAWLRVVGEASDRTEGLVMAAALKPDLLVLNVGFSRQPEESIISFRQQHADLTILVLAAGGLDRNDRFVACGADSCLPVAATGPEMLAMIQALAARKRQVAYLRVSLQRSLRALTQRERQTLRFVAQGLNARQAADIMGISRRTVETHGANLKKKLGLRSRAELVRFALKAGLSYGGE